MEPVKQISYEDIFALWKARKPIRIIGIDTGLANVGWGVIEATPQKIKLIAAGVVTTKPSMELPERLNIIEQSFIDIFEEYGVSLMAYEELFYNKKHPNMMNTNLAVGVIINLGWKCGFLPKKFRPQDAKYYIAEKNNASKEELAAAVAIHLGMLPNKLKELKDHSTDGIAHALCYLGLLKQEYVNYQLKK